MVTSWFMIYSEYVNILQRSMQTELTGNNCLLVCHISKLKRLVLDLAFLTLFLLIRSHWAIMLE